MTPRKSHHDSEVETPMKDATKAEFGRRLQDLLVQKGWNQSDLARAAFGTDEHGNARSRDAISTYIRGVSFPEPMSLRKIADALGVQPGDLLGTSMMPPLIASTLANTQKAPVTLKQISSDGDTVAINVDAVVSLDQAAQILAILKKKPT